MSDEELRMEEPLPELPESPPEPKEERRRDWDERDEKGQPWEKDEKGPSGDPLGGVIWALILISAGLIFLAETTLGLFDFEQFGGAWNVIFVAVGLILLLEVALRLLIPAYRRPISGTLVFAFILLALGLSGIIGWQITWPVFIIAIGLAMLISGLLRWR
jgi:hypothetical protein